MNSSLQRKDFFEKFETVARKTGDFEAFPLLDGTSPSVALANNHPRRNRINETIQDRYCLLQRLGAGTCGDAYLSEDQQLRRRCVLKFCPQSDMF